MYFHEENYYLTAYDFGGQMGLLINCVYSSKPDYSI